MSTHTPKPTPGPWVASGNGVHVRSRCVATTHADPKAQRDIDARLIAAAPDLLELLQRCAELLDDYSDVNDGDDGQPRPNRAMSLLQDVEAAIAKAEGR